MIEVVAANFDVSVTKFFLKADFLAGGSSSRSGCRPEIFEVHVEFMDCCRRSPGA